MNRFSQILRHRSMSLVQGLTVSLYRPQQSSTPILYCISSYLFSTSTVNNLTKSSNSSTNIKDGEQNNCQFYFDEFVKNNQLTKKDLADPKAISKLKLLIASILEEYEYELYKKNFNFNQIENAKLMDSFSFNLQPYELWDLIKIEDENELHQTIRFFANNKINVFGTFSNRRTMIEERREKSKEESLSRAVEFQPGLFSADNQLIYGLWHNALFVKMKRSSMSKLFARRVTSASLIENNPRLVIDLDYSTNLNYLATRVLVSQIRQMISFNKYKSKCPYTLEFVQTVPEDTTSFGTIMSRFIPSWPDEFPYVLHHKPLQEVYPSNSLYYITPLAKRPLTVDELSDPGNIMVLPGFVTRNVRDRVYSKANSVPGCNVRRLPTTEHIVWNRFHGAIALDITFAIIHDMRFNVANDWEEAFQRNLNQSLIKDSQELIHAEEKRKRSYLKRMRSIEQTSRYNSYDHHDHSNTNNKYYDNRQQTTSKDHQQQQQQQRRPQSKYEKLLVKLDPNLKKSKL